MATDQPGGPGKFARRNDLGNVKKIQRDAKIQESAGGAYGQRSELQGLASGAPMAQAPSQSMASAIPVVGAFEPTQRPDEPVTAGVNAGEGPGSEVLMTPIDAPDQLSVLARAMYMANPTPQLRRIVEAFDEEGR